VGAMKERPPVLQSLLVALFITYMIVPIIATYIFSIATKWDITLMPEGYTLEWYQTAFDHPYFSITLTNSFIVSIAAVLVGLLFIVPTTYWVHTRVPAAKPLLDLLMILPFGIPAVVLALALIRVYSFPPLARSPFLLISACVIFSMPFMYRPVSNSLMAVDVHTLTESALSLGANTLQILIRVIAPNIMPGILSGSLLVFATVFAEFTLANLITGASFKTFPLLLVEFTRRDGRIAAALSVISFTVAWLASLALLWVGGRGRKPTEEALGAR
jgi:putative spermidine/putrescine transport system permease protein